jgi:hypothetical protein
MIDLFLKFKDEATASKVLFSEQDGVRVFNFDGVVDVIGTVYKPTGKILTTADGPVEQTAAIPGWHVNYRGAEAEELLAYQVFPSAPVRGWA